MVEQTGIRVADVAAVVVNCNVGVLLRDCIESLLEQVDEIVIVDHDSSDGGLARMFY